ncbi:hypothetical protein BGW80DRAFT_1326026, partial [Lactifluus volemus]
IVISHYIKAPMLPRQPSMPTLLIGAFSKIHPRTHCAIFLITILPSLRPLPTTSKPF